MKFRKKPVIVEAMQWQGPGTVSGVRQPTTQEFDTLGLLVRVFGGEGPFGIVDTLEGSMVVSPGDWIITGVQGERYPCKPDIFEATYEPVEEDTA